MYMYAQLFSVVIVQQQNTSKSLNRPRKKITASSRRKEFVSNFNEFWLSLNNNDRGETSSVFERGFCTHISRYLARFSWRKPPKPVRVKLYTIWPREIVRFGVFAPRSTSNAGSFRERFRIRRSIINSDISGPIPHLPGQIRVVITRVIAFPFSFQKQIISIFFVVFAPPGDTGLFEQSQFLCSRLSSLQK